MGLGEGLLGVRVPPLVLQGSPLKLRAPKALLRGPRVRGMLMVGMFLSHGGISGEGVGRKPHLGGIRPMPLTPKSHPIPPSRAERPEQEEEGGEGGFGGG